MACTVSTTICQCYLITYRREGGWILALLDVLIWDIWGLFGGHSAKAVLQLITIKPFLCQCCCVYNCCMMFNMSRCCSGLQAEGAVSSLNRGASVDLNWDSTARTAAPGLASIAHKVRTSAQGISG